MIMDSKRLNEIKRLAKVIVDSGLSVEEVGQRLGIKHGSGATADRLARNIQERIHRINQKTDVPPVDRWGKY
jgi:hypothetical protein